MINGWLRRKSRNIAKKIENSYSKSRQTSLKEFFMKRQLFKEIRNQNIWQIQEAKAKFSQVIENANIKGYQTITKQGEPVAVILSKIEFDKMTQPKKSLLNFFKSAPYPDVELDIERSKDLPREIEL